MSDAQDIFPGFPHQVKVADVQSTERIEEAADWLTDNFDAENWRYWGSTIFLFKNYRDAVAFKLAWG